MKNDIILIIWYLKNKKYQKSIKNDIFWNLNDYFGI